MTGLQDERTASPGIASDRGRMDTSSSLGRSGTVSFPDVSNIENQTSSVRSDRKDTAEGRRESSSSRKRKSLTVERPSGRLVRMRLQPDKLTPELRTGTKRARVATALACSIASGDGFYLLAVDAIKKQESLVPSRQLLERDDYEPSYRKYMLQCARHNE